MDSRDPSQQQPDDAERRLPVPHVDDERRIALRRPDQGLSPLGVGYQEAPAAAQDEIDLLQYWRLLVKRKWLIIAVAIFALGWAFVTTLLDTKIYRATAVVQIQNEAVKIINMGDTGPAQGWSDRGFFETELELLQSRSLAQRVVGDLGLLDSGEFERIRPPSTKQKLMALLQGEDAEVGMDDPATAPQGGAGQDADRLRGLAGSFGGGLSVAPVGESSLVRLSYDSPSPQFSVKAANGFADGYVASNLERRFDSTSYAKTFLEERLKELKVRLADSERELVSYAQKEQIVGSREGGVNLTEQNLDSINSALSAARSERLKAEARWRQAQASTGTVVAGMIGEKSMIQTLQQNLGEVQSEYQNKLALFKPSYPKMLELKAQISELERQIDREVASIKVAFRAEYDAALAQEKTLVEMLDEMKGEFLDLQNRSINYTILKREVDTNRELYDGLLQRYKEIGVAAGVGSNNLSVVDHAESGYKVRPNMQTNLAIGLVLGLALGVLLALGLEYLDDTIKMPEDIEAKLKLVHLGLVPKLGKDETPAKAAEDLRSGFSEAYRSIRTALQFSTESGIPITLAITSTTPGEGKTTTAVALAHNFAQLGKRVLLIDADLRNPSVHRVLGIENERGLSNCLAGANKPGECIQKLPDISLSVLTSGPLPPNPAELLAGARMLSLLTQATERYDQIVIDAPPVVGLADAPIIANIVSGTVLVVESGRARIGAVQASIKRLHAARAHLLGAVLTKFDTKAASYGYGSYSYMTYEYYAYGGKPAGKLLGKR